MTEMQRKTFAALLSVVLACLIIAPTVAFAEERNGEIRFPPSQCLYKAFENGHLEGHIYKH